MSCPRGPNKRTVWWALIFILNLSPHSFTHAARMCPARCECRDDELAVVCENAQLDMVPWTLHPRLRTLNLQGNQIKEIGGSFSVFSALRSLDLSANQLVDLGRRSFASLVSLEVLDLSRNMIAGLNNLSFDGLPHLDQLYLSFNYIDDVPTETFREMTVLQLLDLSHNRIKTFRNADVFRGCGKKLRTLSLRNNELTSVPTNIFGPLGELAVLDIGLNDITEISPEAFLPLRTLEELRLDGCKLNVIHPGGLRALGGLRVLKLEDNELTDTPSNSFADIPRLEEIHLGQNPLIRLKERAFQHLRHLRMLNIRGATELKDVDSNALIDNQQLEELTLSHNVRLKRLDPATFRPLSKLRSVNLRANGLVNLPVDLLSVSWDDLVELDIRDNPLVCNCSMRWLLTKRRSHSIETGSPQRARNSSYLVGPFTNETTRVKCAEPPHLAGLYLDELQQEDALECQGWPRVVRSALLLSGGGLVFLLISVGIVTCCVKYRGQGISLCRRKLSAKTSDGNKLSSSGAEWLGHELEKAEYLFTDLPHSTETISANSPDNGVYICQLSSTQRSSNPSSMRLLPQSIQGPDLLDIYGGPRDGFTSVPRQPARITLNSSGTNGRIQHRTLRQSVAQESSPPFCYYFE